MKAIEDMTIQEMVKHREDAEISLAWALVNRRKVVPWDKQSLETYLHEKEVAERGLNEITIAMDKKCEEAGITLVDGHFEYFPPFYDRYTLGLYDGSSVEANIPAADQHALEGYLLSKNQ